MNNKILMECGFGLNKDVSRYSIENAYDKEEIKRYLERR